MEEGALLFQLQFEIKKPIQKLEEAFQLVRDRSIAQAFRYTGEARELQLSFKEEPLTGTIPASSFQLLANSPNPFRTQTQVRYYLPATDQVSMTLTDLSGKVILRREEKAAKGWQESTIDAQDLGLTAGLYILHLKTKKRTGSS